MHTIPYTAVYNEAGYIEFVYEGILLPADVMPMIFNAVSMARKYNCYAYLGDFRDVETQFSTTAIYEIPAQFFAVAQKQGIPVWKLKRALIAAPERYETFKFFEKVSCNRGQKVKVFTDGEEAMDWLMGSR